MYDENQLRELYKVSQEYVEKALDKKFDPPLFRLAPLSDKYKKIFQTIIKREKERYPYRLKGLPTEIPAILVRSKITSRKRAEIIGNPDLLPKYPRYLVLTTFCHELLHYLGFSVEVKIDRKAKEIVDRFEPAEKGAEAAFYDFYKNFPFPEMEELSLSRKFPKNSIIFRDRKKNKIETVIYLISFVLEKYFVILILTGTEDFSPMDLVQRAREKLNI